MNILVVGGGARDHALAWKLSLSPKAEQIFVAPGNAGTAQFAHNLDINPTDINSIVKAALDNRVRLTVVGPEAPLAAGIGNHFNIRGMPIFAPTRNAAEIESSKVFAKDLMQKYHIPCARSASFSDYAKAKQYLEKQKLPVVIKADGLAAGKGVVVAETKPQAIAALSDFMEKKTLGAAGNSIVIEECLVGKEMSYFAFTDTHSTVPAVPACDYKRVFDNGKGPNTGGMGAYSPPVFFNAELGRKIDETIMKPVVKALQSESRPYEGILYGGLMITAEGPKVLEFNARFGDPETQVILPRLKTDLVDIMLAIGNKELGITNIEWSEDASVGVVLASGGYPGDFKTGFPITGLDDLDKDVLVFHAGTKIGKQPGEILTSGGRVLTVVATGKTLAEAREKVYANVARIHFEGCHYRKDIAQF
ncbi:MAG: phosphoribosylamine--glycine ligase [Dehalococcoidales bacterium]|nr:phosphoribosylamine--glycine ligase [Dehalococcoidales bacterium]